MNVVLCGDLRMFNEALTMALRAAGCRVVASTSDLHGAVDVVGTEKVDVCLVELATGDPATLSAIGEVLRVSPTTKVVILAASPDPELQRRAAGAGARGVTSMSADMHEIVDVMNRVHRGQLVVDLPGGGAGGGRAGGGRGPQQGRGTGDGVRRPHDLLTPREQEVLGRLVQGESTAAVAQALGVKFSTARAHIQSIFNKLGVHSKVEAVAYAVRAGLVPVDDGTPSLVERS